MIVSFIYCPFVKIPVRFYFTNEQSCRLFTVSQPNDVGALHGLIDIWIKSLRKNLRCLKVEKCPRKFCTNHLTQMSHLCLLVFRVAGITLTYSISC